jgi:hypothetical protein
VGNYWVSNVAGSSQTQLTGAGTGFAIRVAPSGKKLIFNAPNGVTSNSNLWIVNVDGTGSLSLTSTIPPE